MVTWIGKRKPKWLLSEWKRSSISEAASSIVLSCEPQCLKTFAQAPLCVACVRQLPGGGERRQTRRVPPLTLLILYMRLPAWENRKSPLLCWVASGWKESPLLVVLSLYRISIIKKKPQKNPIITEVNLSKNWITAVEFRVQGLVSVSARAELRVSTGRKHSFESCSSGFRGSGPLTSAWEIIRLSNVFQETVSLFVLFEKKLKNNNNLLVRQPLSEVVQGAAFTASSVAGHQSKTWAHPSSFSFFFFCKSKLINCTNP